MAGLIVGRITAQLGLDDAGFASGVRRAGSSMQQLGQQTRQSEQAISSAMKGAVSEVDRYAAKVAQARANQAAAAARAEKAERQLQAAQNAGNADKAADAELRLAQARARLTTASIATQEAAAGLAEANTQAAESSDGASESITNMGDSSDTTAGKLAAMAAGAIGAGAAMSKILTVGMDFTTSLNTMQAVSGATSAQMKDVSAAAKALGGDITLPGTSANNAAAAMTELAKGGFSVQQSMDAAKGTLQLAAAAQIEAGDAATIQSQALQAFGADATYASEAADILSNASNASSAEITDVAAALQQAGTVAAGFGVSMADTATMIGLFANAGITGSDAGTLLKTSLQSLTDQGAPAQQAIKDLGLTVYDAQGNFVGMRSLWEQLSAASKSMSAEQFQAATNILFGSDAMRTAMVAAGGGTEAYDKMSAAINKQGTAATIAAAKTQGLPGAWERVQNSIEGVALTTYSMIEGPLTSLANTGAGVIGTADGMAASLGFVVAPVAALASLFAAIPGPLQTVITLMIAGRIATAAFGNQLGAVRNFAGNAVGGLRSVVSSTNQVIQTSRMGAVSMGRFGSSIAQIGTHSPVIARMQQAYMNAATQASSFARTQGAVSAAAVGMRGAVGGLAGALGGPFGIAIMGAIGFLTIWSRNSQAAKQKTAEHKAAVDELSQSIDVNTGKLTQQGRELVSKKLEDTGILKVIDANQKWGVSIDQFTDAATGQVDAIDSVNVALDKQVAASVESSDYWKTNAKDYEAAGVSLQELTMAIRGNAAAQESVEGKLKGAGWKDYESAVGRAKNSLDENGNAAIRTGDALGNMGDNIDEAAAKAMRQAQANNDVRKSFDGSVEAIGPMTAAMTEFNESTDGAASKVDKLAKALDQLQDDSMTEEEALQSWSDNMRELVEAMGDGGAAAIGLNGTIDVTTEKGSKLQNTVRDQASAFTEMAAATFEAAKSQGQDLPTALDTTRQKLEQQRTAFVDQLTAITGNREQAEALADAYGLIPSEVVLNLDSTAIQTGIDRLGSLGIKATTLPPGEVMIVDNTPETTRKLNELGIKTQTLPDGKVAITDTTPENLKRLDELGIKTTTLPGGFVQITDTSEENVKRLNDLGIKTTTLPDGTVVVHVDDAAAIDKMLWFERSRKTTVTVDVKKGIDEVSDVVSGIGFAGGGRVPGYAEGGKLSGPGTGTSDSILGVDAYGMPTARVSSGEFVVREKQTSRFMPLLSAINAGRGIFGRGGTFLNRLAGLAGGGIASAGQLKDYMRGIEGQPYSYGDWGNGWMTDCSGGQSIAMNYADGLNASPGTGARAGTASFDSYTAGHGLQPGTAPAGTPAYEVGWSPEHTAGTIYDPAGGDVNVEMGGGRGDGQYGGPTGSRDGQFNQIAWMPLQGDPGAAGQIGAPDTRTPKQKNIDTVIAEGKRRGESDKEIKSAVMAVLAETGGENLDHGMDGDNAGILQQRPSWGTKEQRMDPAYAVNAYYDAANKVEGAEGMTEAQLAQAVQRSGTADGSNYAAKAAEADAEIAASVTRSTTTSGSATSGSGDPVFVTNWPSQLTTTTTSTSTGGDSSTPDAASTAPEVTGKGPLPLVAYANGGIQGRPGQATLLNGERNWITRAGEAGLEAFIPVNGSDRSKKLWMETGERLGMLQAFASGGFGGYSDDTTDAMKPKNWYDWAALVAGGGFAVASAITPYINMAQGGQLDLGKMTPTFDTSANSIDGIAQALGKTVDEIKQQIEELTKAVRENGKTLHVVDSGNQGAAGMLQMKAGF